MEEKVRKVIFYTRYEGEQKRKNSANWFPIKGKLIGNLSTVKVYEKLCTVYPESEYDLNVRVTMRSRHVYEMPVTDFIQYATEKE